MSVRVNHENKTVTIGVLTAAEEAMVQMYIKAGYTLKPSKAQGKRRMNKNDILKWFDSKGDEKGKKQFLDNIDKPTGELTKSGEPKKQGYLKALAQFRKDYPEATEEIKKTLN
jgi:hypothetical protein